MYLIKGDNWRERGLDMMMAGRLEANAEEELFKVKEREREREGEHAIFNHYILAGFAKARFYV